MLHELVVGFDIREMYLGLENTWSLEQQESFLLSRLVKKPLSTDTSIWSSIFELNNINLPSSIGWRQNSWGNLNDLRNFWRQLIFKKSSWLICLSQFLTEKDKNDLDYDELSVFPKNIDPSWKFLGFDISEEVLLSGLSNMGYAEDEHTFAVSRFADYLNEYHLFTGYEQASQFVIWCNQRDPGHGPFYVYGLYLIEELGSER